MKVNGPYKSILLLSDIHAPFCHIDLVPFLKALKKKYKPDKIISVGDEADFAGISFHTHNADLYSAGDELTKTIEKLRPIYKLFPKLDLMESNHGSLVYRRAMDSGLPKRTIRSYREVLEAPKGWVWHEDMVVKSSDGSLTYICHNRTKDSLKSSQQIGMNFVSGHFHSTFEIRYWANSLKLHWGMIIGCLVDKDSMAFAYGKTCPAKPIIGCGIILNGIPKLLPMVLNKDGRWNRSVP